MDYENLERAPSDIQDFLEEGNEKRDLIDMLWTALSPEGKAALEAEVKAFHDEIDALDAEADRQEALKWDSTKEAIAKVEPLVVQEYVGEFMQGNTDGFDEQEQKVILKFLDDIALYSANRGDV